MMESPVRHRRLLATNLDDEGNGIGPGITVLRHHSSSSSLPPLKTAPPVVAPPLASSPNRKDHPSSSTLKRKKSGRVCLLLVIPLILLGVYLFYVKKIDKSHSSWISEHAREYHHKILETLVDEEKEISKAFIKAKDQAEAAMEAAVAAATGGGATTTTTTTVRAADAIPPQEQQHEAGAADHNGSDNENDEDEQIAHMLQEFSDACSGFELPTPTPKNPRLDQPIWFAYYPDAMEDKMIKNIVTSLTGYTAGAKSFYASSKNFRHCKMEGSPTAVCMIVHPFVETYHMVAHSKSFQPLTILGLRNPLTAFPAHHNGKAIKYHGHQGQVAVADWRAFRDNYVSTMLQGWTRQIQTWQYNVKPDYYRIGMYFSKERFMHPVHGPKLIQKMARLLRASGFETTDPIEDETNSEPFKCIWFHSIGENNLEQYYASNRYEYNEYVPLYTAEQYQQVTTEISQLLTNATAMAENSATEDEKNVAWDLVEILNEYLADVKRAEVDTA